MASNAVVEFTDANFESEVLSADKPVVVDFWAEWCMPCRMLAPVIDELAAEYEGKAKIGKIDTDANREVTMKYQINAIPTVIVFKDGEVAKKFVGMTNKADLSAAINDAAG
ncbi:thioredoxin [Planctomycetales bacterium ZRK34]|nr:thioredoxin [Planctomycetales bacterium ZRK34]